MNHFIASRRFKILRAYHRLLDQVQFESYAMANPVPAPDLERIEALRMARLHQLFWRAGVDDDEEEDDAQFYPRPRAEFPVHKPAPRPKAGRTRTWLRCSFGDNPQCVACSMVFPYPPSDLDRDPYTALREANGGWGVPRTMDGQLCHIGNVALPFGDDPWGKRGADPWTESGWIGSEPPSRVGWGHDGQEAQLDDLDDLPAIYLPSFEIDGGVCLRPLDWFAMPTLVDPPQVWITLGAEWYNDASALQRAQLTRVDHFPSPPMPARLLPLELVPGLRL
uniref:HNH endonuclease n=1 Tax=Mycena chlorophos TaxID=658473 RepID=A0ABQ0L6S5_MYCCL|nr:predicted protein [Mycena chlorophos]